MVYHYIAASSYTPLGVLDSLTQQLLVIVALHCSGVDFCTFSTFSDMMRKSIMVHVSMGPQRTCARKEPAFRPSTCSGRRKERRDTRLDTKLRHRHVAFFFFCFLLFPHSSASHFVRRNNNGSRLNSRLAAWPSCTFCMIQFAPGDNAILGTQQSWRYLFVRSPGGPTS
jgi:hypothetical protein